MNSAFEKKEMTLEEAIKDAFAQLNFAKELVLFDIAWLAHPFIIVIGRYTLVQGQRKYMSEYSKPGSKRKSVPPAIVIWMTMNCMSLRNMLVFIIATQAVHILSRFQLKEEINKSKQTKDAEASVEGWAEEHERLQKLRPIQSRLDTLKLKEIPAMEEQVAKAETTAMETKEIAEQVEQRLLRSVYRLLRCLEGFR